MLEVLEPYIQLCIRDALKTENYSTLVTIRVREQSARREMQNQAIDACKSVARQKRRMGQEVKARVALDCAAAVRALIPEELV